MYSLHRRMVILTSSHFGARLTRRYRRQKVRLLYPINQSLVNITVKGVIEFSILKGRNLVPMDTSGE